MKTVDFDQLRLRPGDKVLDLGCGEGRHAIALAFEYSVTVLGADLSGESLKRASTAEVPLSPAAQRLWVRTDALHLPLADASVNAVVCSEVLEHIPDYCAVLREIRRVLVPGGCVALSVPRAWTERICWWLDPGYGFEPGGHIRIFNAAELRAQAQRELQMRCVRTAGAHAMHTPYWWLRCWFYRNWEQAAAVQKWHDLLVRDLTHPIAWVRRVEALLNPVMGKSVVLYFR